MKILREDAADLIEMLGMQEEIDDLETPTQEPEHFSAVAS